MPDSDADGGFGPRVDGFGHERSPIRTTEDRFGCPDRGGSLSEFSRIRSGPTFGLSGLGEMLVRIPPWPIPTLAVQRNWPTGRQRMRSVL